MVDLIYIKKQLSCIAMVGKPSSFLSIQHLAESYDEFLCLVHAQAERRQQTDRVGSGYSRKDLLFEQQLAAYFLDRFFELDTDHQTTSANLFNSR